MQKGIGRGIRLALTDIVLIITALTVYALFHHALPRRMEAQIPAATAAPTASSAPTGLHASTPPPNLPTAGMATPTPSPTPAIGDFSAAFPSELTFESALLHYRSDRLAIRITTGKREDATYYAADVWIRDIKLFQTAFADNSYGRGITAMPQEIADDNDAILAMSGDYYGARTGGVVIRNGILYRESVTDDVCVLYRDGTMETYDEAGFRTEDAVARGAYQAWSFGPRLLVDGEIPERYNSNLLRRHPRAAIGYYEPGHYCLVAVGGRQEGHSQGMTLMQLSELMQFLGCREAYNLDGGQTAMMLFEGQPVNRPYRGGRRVSDIIFFNDSGEDAA